MESMANSMSALNEEQLGEVAYNAYCSVRDWKSYDGKPLPRWPEVKGEIKAGWCAAAMAVGHYVVDELTSVLTPKTPITPAAPNPAGEQAP